MNERPEIGRLPPLLPQAAPPGEEAEETLHAIVAGEADALVLETRDGPRVYTLKEANEPYRRLIEQMSEAAIILGDDAVVLYSNGRLARMLGRETLVGGDFFDVVAAHDRARAEELLTQGADSNTTIELALIGSQGELTAFRVSATPLPFNGGRCVALLLMPLDKIEALKLSQAVLRESEERFRAVFTHAGNGIVITDWRGRFQEANPAYCGLLGYTLEELRQITFPELIHPDDRDAALAEIRRLQDQELPYFSIENRYVRKDGAIVWVQKFVSLLRDEKGMLAHIVAIVTDVTERRRLEQNLRDEARRKDEFLATLAHELRNPLAPISSALHVLERKGDDPIETQRLYAMMGRQVSHLVRLVDDLLDASRIASGKIELHKERVELREALRQAIETSAPLIEAEKHRLTLKLSDEPLVVEGDPVRLAQIFANLLNNAAKYTPAGGWIELTSRREGDQAIVGVRDNGVGVKADMLPRVFDLFVQAKRASGRSYGGMGVGLALARRLVELHGGSIAGFSEGEDLGSEFVVRLNLAAAPASIGEQAGGDTARAPAGRRVLVVDDDHDVADSFVMLLQCLGAEVRVAYDGPSAVSAVAEFSPQVVFLDIGMPGMDGYETARRMRELDSGRSVTIAALSGWGQSHDRRQSLEAGFDHHFVKPMDIEAVERLLAAHSTF